MARKRFRSEYARAQEVAKRLLKPSWVKRFHGGDEDAAARALAEEHGFSGRPAYMRHLCELLIDFPDQEGFEQAVQEHHDEGLRVMGAGLAHCEITDNPALLPQKAQFSKTTVGDCYTQAYYYATDHAPDGSILIHGHIREGRPSSKHIGHAWVELPCDIVFDGVLQKFYHKDGYYEARNAKRTLAFPKKEAIFVMIKYRHFGPWNGE
jgi:hypothetical protein